jgi:hypothetical protein
LEKGPRDGKLVASGPRKWATTNNYIKLCKLVASGPRMDAIDRIGHGIPN